MKRVDFDPYGNRNPQNRGKSHCERISWDEAVDMVAGEIKRIRDTYGGPAITGMASSHHNWIAVILLCAGPFDWTGQNKMCAVSSVAIGKHSSQVFLALDMPGMGEYSVSGLFFCYSLLRFNTSQLAARKGE